jgi:hypothetical protein
MKTKRARLRSPLRGGVHGGTLVKAGSIAGGAAALTAASAAVSSRRRVPSALGSSHPVLSARANRARRLSEGALAQGSIRARLLGLPLLRLDATIVLLPAALDRPSPRGTDGNELIEAVRRINEGADVLARVRDDGRR